LIRFSSIGDIVLTTSLIRCLKTQYPKAEIYFLTKASFKPLLENNPHLSGVIGMQKNLSDVMSSIREIKPDYLIDLHGNLRSGFLKLKLGIKSYTIPKLRFKRWRMVQTHKRETLPHINERYFSALEKLDVHYDGQGLEYFFPTGAKVLREIAGIILPDDYDAWVIGATHFTKRLPEEKIVEGIKLRRRRVILLGGRAETSAGQRIASDCRDLVVNLCGETNFSETAAVIEKAGVVFTNDTGFMHIAAALKKKIVCFWGGTVPELGMTPLLPHDVPPAIIIENNLAGCRPCSKIGKASCPLGHFACMKEIDMHQIKEC
jgi:heptosyltransferase-2